ncbi:MAG: DUF4982 domain-containing protein [Firmicutes bacterium]|nr:DUF4982 domain-containing protein [Bacillota bacterium]MCM1401518.1 DUF4982 domain-containing protein [Bacteroides sp.]MCM1477368.1 DUF4982 domain-containing protein [Bacteroides sp.]
MVHIRFSISVMALAGAMTLWATSLREVSTLTQGWQFSKGHGEDASEWKAVRVPHDWAITGPFDRANDLQSVAVWQNGETVESLKTGRTGGLPFIGKGTYRTSFNVADTASRCFTILFDGAMSNARVMVNGKEVVSWPYGYNSFYTDISNAVIPGENLLTVELENKERASRWYPGAGLYRNVHLITSGRVHIPVWGTYVTTPTVSAKEASVRLEMEIEGAAKGEKIEVVTDILNPSGNKVASNSAPYTAHGQTHHQNFIIERPELWDTENPALYSAVTRLFINGDEVDSYTTRFGIRKLEYVPERGFFLNNNPVKFKGVCNHHDLGPLGAAVNRSALRYRIELLKDMGVNAIRTSHNMPSPELVDLCNEMGMMLMVEPFDDWGFRPKSPNGYGAIFEEWAERDVTNMVRQFRNAPSVVMWSIGNEVPSQWGPDGVGELTMLRDIVRHLDSTRPITCGMDQINSVLDNGFAASLDIPSFNYKPQYYEEAYNKLPQRMVLGSESASTVSSRGIYYFPVSFGESDHNEVLHPENQSSSYDNESCSWSNPPDIDLFMDSKPWVLGQFIWTGFDYLGEPSPYDTDAWPSHSSLFGAIDLAFLPKDRFYLYRSVWNTTSPTLHILPHWNWPGREGEITPVFVYTSYPKAELFINGKSHGIREKSDSTLQNRFRLMWMDTRYEPGEVKVVALDSAGNPVAERSMRTPGKPHHLTVCCNRPELSASGSDLAFITISVTDKDGNPVATDTRKVTFNVSGAGTFEATANGDPTCLSPFHIKEVPLFSGSATAIVRAADTPGELTFTVSAKGLKPARLTIPVK